MFSAAVRLEQVRATTGAVTDVVADEVRDDARVAGVVLRDALLDLADEIGADVGGLGVDAAAQLREEGDERGAEAEADDEERRVLDRLRGQATEGREDAVDAEQRQGDDEEARDGAAAHRDLHRLDEAPSRGRRRAHVGLDADVHADDAGRHRARRADEEREAGPPAEGQTVARRSRRPPPSRRR